MKLFSNKKQEKSLVSHFEYFYNEKNVSFFFSQDGDTIRSS